METLLDRVLTEADLCRNEGADDIANLLMDVALVLSASKTPCNSADWANAAYKMYHARKFKDPGLYKTLNVATFREIIDVTYDAIVNAPPPNVPLLRSP